jgi:DNA-binding transcriptional MerR regulator
MPQKYLRTSDIAKAVGVHSNTVRLYEEWGFLPPIPRTASSYRQFTEKHLDQMRLAWMALHSESWIPSKKILAQLVRQAATDDLGGALELAYTYISTIRSEYIQAESALEFVERWAKGQATDSTPATLRIGEVAELTGLSRDMLRNWERDGLIAVPRNQQNKYRLYGAQEIGQLRVLRMLRNAGYSTMAILRLVQSLNKGQTDNLREILDTPDPDEDIFSAADSWLSTLKECEQRGKQIIQQLETMIDNQHK